MTRWQGDGTRPYAEPTPRIRGYVEALLARWPDITTDEGESSPELPVCASADRVRECVVPPATGGQGHRGAARESNYGCLRGTRRHVTRSGVVDDFTAATGVPSAPILNCLGGPRRRVSSLVAPVRLAK